MGRKYLVMYSSLNHLPRTILILIIGLNLAKCSSDRLDISIENKSVDIPLLRMDQDWPVGFASGKVAQSINERLLSKYGLLYELFIQKMIQEGSVHDPMIGDNLYSRLKSDALMMEVVPELHQTFRDFSAYKKELDQAMNYYQHYFPDSTLPNKYITFFSYFNAQAMVINDDLCIGLDMYLGSNHPIVKKLPVLDFPQFFKDKMEEKYLVANALKAWLLEKMYQCHGNDFLDKIVAAGKIMYLMDAIMPQVDPEIKMSYTKEEYQWAIMNEDNIWQQLVEQDLLYSKEDMLEINWISDGPFTKGLPTDSPSRMGIWMGWQMVKDFMVANPEVSLNELVIESNSKRILKYYDPKE